MAKHLKLVFLVSPDESFNIAYSSSKPESVTEEPADLANFAPFPGISSTL